MTDLSESRGRRVVRLIVGGKVQGVGYRAWLAREAGRLALEGWARNLPNGSVEAVVAGDPDAVATLAEAVIRGPVHARVAGLQILDAVDEALDLRRAGVVFDILPDA